MRAHTLFFVAGWLAGMRAVVTKAEAQSYLKTDVHCLLLVCMMKIDYRAGCDFLNAIDRHPLQQYSWHARRKTKGRFR